MAEDRAVTLEPRDAERNQDIAITAVDLRVDGTDSSFSVIEEVTLRLTRGRTLGIVGETGSGKTTVALSLLGYARPGVRVAGGSVQLGDTDLLALSPAELRRRRGRDIAYVPQDPSTGLTPGMRVGDALREMLAIHASNESNPGARVAAALREAQLPDDPAFQRRYPFQLSGGQQQRVALMRAVMMDPPVLLLDEPMAALDPLLRRMLQQELRGIFQRLGKTVLLVTHDLGEAAFLAQTLTLLHGGRVVQTGTYQDLLSAPSDPFVTAFVNAQRPAPELTGSAPAVAGLQ